MKVSVKRCVLVVLLAVAAVSVPCAPPSSPVVYVTANGKKFHARGCRTIKKSQVRQMTREEALKAGLAPCKICKP